MRDDIRELQKVLTSTDMACVPAGKRSTADEVYELVSQSYPELCDDSLRCAETCNQGSDQPEWKHAVRRVQQQLARQPENRVSRHEDHGYWSYGPLFDPGEREDRREIHDRFGGARYRGIAPSGDHPLIFLFTGESGAEHGYEDEFRGETFVYTGEGREGDMEIVGGNRAIRNHRKDGRQLHLFEDTDEAWQVTYVGQFEYADHFWQRLPDTNGEMREAIRFELEPAGGSTIEFDGTLDDLTEQELYKRAERAATAVTSEGGNTPSGSSSMTTYTRSDPVKRFARRMADGVCRGCDREAPFVDENGEPFLEVHHLNRRSDGGADHPDNVIAICPNCHRRVHHGQDGDQFNQKLAETVKERRPSR
jgi:5-methylcytosine-specific restriction protein A